MNSTTMLLRTQPHTPFLTPTTTTKLFPTTKLFTTTTVSFRRAAVTTTRMSLTQDTPTIAVVGVTGAVGHEFLSVLTDRNFPYKLIKMLASKRSARKEVTFKGRSYVVEELTAESFDGVDIALFSAGGGISKR
ncbi:hypothetical protein RND81_03G039000 [Saponaria officinalis]|uniref:Semialdehyde dehydrogenase NAD-binding domain-containing protein n=1 Tax=Saponaria officinalis TaxID=3572 RepID=A0AAW1LY22_SAPOF